MSCRQRIDARASVSAKRLNQTSSIDKLYQQGSARIRFPNTPNHSSPLQAVLINTAGGLTGDDRIHWEGEAGEQSHLCLSTAACEKIYRSHGPNAHQTTTLRAAENARLAWLPQESIVFNGARLKRTLDLNLDASAEALVVESLVFGRQASQENIDDIAVHDRWRIYQHDKLLHAEDLKLDITNQAHAPLSSIMHQYRAISTLVLVSTRGQEWLELVCNQIRQLAEADKNSLKIGASVLPHRLVIRFLAIDSYCLRKILIPCIGVVNDGHPVPTVWNV